MVRIVGQSVVGPVSCWWLSLRVRVLTVQRQHVDVTVLLVRVESQSVTGPETKLVVWFSCQCGMLVRNIVMSLLWVGDTEWVFRDWIAVAQRFQKELIKDGIPHPKKCVIRVLFFDTQKFLYAYFFYDTLFKIVPFWTALCKYNQVHRLTKNHLTVNVAWLFWKKFLAVWTAQKV